jgi:hypothetical protein
LPLLSPKYVVKNEHTLGYMYDTHGKFLTVYPLASKPWDGGHDPKNGGVACFPRDIRPATAADFAYFRLKMPSNFEG